MDFSAKEWADEDSHTDVLGNGSGDTCTPDTQFKDENQEHIPEMFKIPPEARPSIAKKGFSLVSENVIHNAAGCHGWCCNKDPGAIFDRVRKDGVSASKETHEGSVEEKAKDANEGAT